MAKMQINTDYCKGCGLCINTCPKKLISVNRNILNAKGYHPASVTEMDKCIGCGFCALTCPDCAITVER